MVRSTRIVLMSIRQFCSSRSDSFCRNLVSASMNGFFTSMVSAICGNISSASRVWRRSKEGGAARFASEGPVLHRLRIVAPSSLHREENHHRLNSPLGIADAVRRALDAQGHEKVRDVVGNMDDLEEAVHRPPASSPTSAAQNAVRLATAQAALMKSKNLARSVPKPVRVGGPL